MASQAVQLPKTIAEIQSQSFSGWSIAKILQACSTNKNLSPSQKLIWKYCGSSLTLGRPLDSAIILMAGASGTGKSSTINSLFADKDLCKTSSVSSETKDTIMVRKLLKVTAETPTLGGFLSFIDVPGTFDTDARNEAANMASIRKLKTVPSVGLADRDCLSAYATAIQKSVYPNIVLFVVRASDDRIDGPDSIFAKSLKAFQKTADFLDVKKNNAIVVLTHAMSLSPRKDKFVAKLAEKTAVIKKQFRIIFGINDVPVVPVENEPEDFKLETFGDFYLLPDGQISHVNLFKAMLKVFDENGDILGRLLTCWYFHGNCPEKRKKAEKRTMTGPDMDDAEKSRAAEDLRELNICASKGDIIPTYNFQRLSHAYCPVTEEFKSDMPLESLGDLRTVQIENSKFAVPKFVQVYKKQSSEFKRLSFMEKEEYQQHMQHKYGLEAGFKLAVSVSSNGKWVNSRSSSAESSLVSVVYEVQMATFSLTNPRKQALSPALLQELQNLPDEYKPATWSKFQAFFCRWGSHLVTEQCVGGSIQVDCTVQKASLSQQQINNVEAMISGMFKGIFAGAEYSHSSQMSQMRQVGISSGHLRIDGGLPPPLMTLESVTPEALRGWVKTVSQDPAELKSSIKLYPYYNFLDSGKKHEGLREATKDYLSNTLSAKIQSKIDSDRNAIAEAETKKTVAKRGGGGCFPGGALVTMASGELLEIEKLDATPEKLQTVKLGRGGKSVKKIGSTDYCTYLDRKDDGIMEYLILDFENGRQLAISDTHLMYEYLKNDHSVFAKQARYFKVGESALYVERNGVEFEMEERKIVRISKELRLGAYAPLTGSGTLLVDGFLVTSYADIDCFGMGQTALAPLKLWCKMKNRKGSGTKASPSNEKFQGVHPYPKFLIGNQKLLEKLWKTCHQEKVTGFQNCN